MKLSEFRKGTGMQELYKTKTGYESPTTWARWMPADILNGFKNQDSILKLNLQFDDKRIQPAIVLLKTEIKQAFRNKPTDEEIAEYLPHCFGGEGEGEKWTKRRIATLFCKLLAEKDKLKEINDNGRMILITQEEYNERMKKAEEAKKEEAKKDNKPAKKDNKPAKKDNKPAKPTASK